MHHGFSWFALPCPFLLRLELPPWRSIRGAKTSIFRAFTAPDLPCGLAAHQLLRHRLQVNVDRFAATLDFELRLETTFSLA